MGSCLSVTVHTSVHAFYHEICFCEPEGRMREGGRGGSEEELRREGEKGGREEGNAANGNFFFFSE